MNKSGNFHGPMAFTIYGVLFGVLFPLFALFPIAFENSCTFYEAHMIHGGTLIWIIDLAPIVIGVTFYFLGIKHQRVRKQNEELEEEVINNKILYEKHKTIVDLSVTYNHEINNPLAIAVAMVGDLEQLHGSTEEVKTLMRALQRIHEVVRAIDDIKKAAPQEISYSEYSSDTNLIRLNKKAS